MMTSKHFLTTGVNVASAIATLLDAPQVHFYCTLHQQVTQHIGLFPQQLNPRMVSLVLDVACGPGFWVREVASTYPHMEVVGLDMDPDMVLCAQKLTCSSLNQHAQFMPGDMCELMLGRHCLDLLHLRFLASIISPLEWMDFLDNLIPLCRPGGYLVWTEAHVETTSVACLNLYTLLQRAMGKSTTHAPSDVTSMMDVLLGDTICQQVERSTVYLDLSAGTSLHVHLLHHIVEIIGLLQPFLSAQQVASTEEIDRICREFLIAAHDDAFVCALSLVTVTGYVPLV